MCQISHTKIRIFDAIDAISTYGIANQRMEYEIELVRIFIFIFVLNHERSVFSSGVISRHPSNLTPSFHSSWCGNSMDTNNSSRSRRGSCRTHQLRDAAACARVPQPLVLAVLQAPWPIQLSSRLFMASIEFNSVKLLIGTIISDSSSIRWFNLSTTRGAMAKRMTELDSAHQISLSTCMEDVLIIGGSLSLDFKKQNPILIVYPEPGVA